MTSSDGTGSQDQVMYRGAFIQVRKARVLLPDGRIVEKEQIVHPDSVTIVPVLDENQIVMIRQYRPVLERELWELPAGKMDPGEEPVDAARRELQEETGYRAARLSRVLGFYPAPGIMTEYMHVFVAHELTLAKTAMDEDEHIVTEVKSRQEVEQLLRDGEIQDAKSLIALTWWASRQEG